MKRLTIDTKQQQQKKNLVSLDEYKRDLDQFAINSNLIIIKHKKNPFFFFFKRFTNFN